MRRFFPSMILFAPDIVPKTFKDTLSLQDMANVIAFLSTQE